MSGKFVTRQALVTDQLDWGSIAWHSRPEFTQCRELVLLEVCIQPGKGHNFHRHPRQEEIIFVLEGQIEQWIGQEKSKLGPGDSAFIGAGVVHASFNTGQQEVRLLAILGPSVGAEGYELEEVYEQAPWNSLRT